MIWNKHTTENTMQKIVYFDVAVLKYGCTLVFYFTQEQFQNSVIFVGVFSFLNQITNNHLLLFITL